MGNFLAVAIFSIVVTAQSSLATAKAEQNTDIQSAPVSQSTSGNLSALPPRPPGKSTVIGGAIRDVDHVRDQFTLKIFGGQSMKILFDARTQVYRDGAKMPVRDLGPDAHASVETVLDGTNVFALSIHMLSHPPEGESQGQVISYDPGTGELKINSSLSHVPIELNVPANTPVVRGNQTASSSTAAGPSDLVKGTLISIKFESGTKGRGVARQISILAAPGSEFTFSGKITFLDLHSNVLVLVDPRDDKSYKISFDPARFPISQSLHQGADVTVNTTFDGTRYVASEITAR